MAQLPTEPSGSTPCTEQAPTPSAPPESSQCAPLPKANARQEKERDRERAQAEAQRAKERFEQQRKDMEAKLQAAMARTQQQAQEKRMTVVERPFGETVPAKRPRESTPTACESGSPASSSADFDTIVLTGNKIADSKAAKRLKKQNKEELLGTMGFLGFGKDGGATALPFPGANLKPPNWQEEELVPVIWNAYSFPSEVAQRSAAEVASYRWSREIKIQSGEAPNPFTSFAEAQFPEYILTALRAAEFTEPTPIQSQAWPVALLGRDLVGLAETGSGKTLAYLLPALVHINGQSELQGTDGPIALILAPTRELAQQIQLQADTFGDYASVRNACLYGGTEKVPQRRQVKAGVELCIATPGRLLDFLDCGTTNLKRTSYCVLDEADRMFDMGFEPQVRKVLDCVRPDRQLLMFSATWPRSVERLVRDYLRDPIQILIGKLNTATQNVRQIIVCVKEEHKRMRLLQLLSKIVEDDDEPNPRILLFSDTKRNCEELCLYLESKGHAAVAIHGDKSQFERDVVMEQFREGTKNILVATDVAARGLDIKEIRYVLNYELPAKLDEYVHRIGRTGRGGSTGVAYTIITPSNSHLASGLLKILQDAHQEVPQDLLDLMNHRGKFAGSRPSHPSYHGHRSADVLRR